MDELDKTSAKIDRDKRIKKEIAKLDSIFHAMDDDTKKAASSLIHNAAFMMITLEDLRESINLNGIISEYKNGENQFGTKKSPEVETYNTMIKNHMSIIKQLTDLLPKPSTNGTGDDLEDFAAAKK